MSQEALSREISSVVARVVGGEEIDAAERGAMLAAKYPDLGMSGEMIGEAITRAAGMVGMIKNAPKPVAWPDTARAATESPPAYGEAEAALAPALPKAAIPVLAQSIDADLASTIDAEIGSLVSGNAAAQEEPAEAAVEGPGPTPKVAPKPTAPARRFAPVAALRRAFFRH